MPLTLALTLTAVLLISSAYLFRQWYTGDLKEKNVGLVSKFGPEIQQKGDDDNDIQNPGGDQRDGEGEGPDA